MSKILLSQSEIESREVARMIHDFWHEFKDTYGKDTMESSLCAVGPLQSMIGLAIRNGRLSIPKPKGETE